MEKDNHSAVVALQLSLAGSVIAAIIIGLLQRSTLWALIAGVILLLAQFLGVGAGSQIQIANLGGHPLDKTTSKDADGWWEARLGGWAVGVFAGSLVVIGVIWLFG